MTNKSQTLEELIEPYKIIAGIDKKIYDSVHHWLRKNYGKAHKCEADNCKNKSKNYEWALKKDCKYEMGRNNFLMLCIPCHRKYDITEATKEKMRKIATNRKQTLFTRRKRAISLFKPVKQIHMDGSVIASFSHIREAQKITGVCNQSITRCAQGKCVFTFWNNDKCKWQYISN